LRGLFLCPTFWRTACSFYMETPRSRDEIVRNIRPELQLMPCASEIETFQNNVLRPILKFQNELLLAICKAYVHKYQKSFNGLNAKAQEQLVKRAMKQDPEIRSTTINVVAGIFTSEEYETYLENRAEHNKRIVGMATERVISQLTLLY
jgi:hypothetical protein